MTSACPPQRHGAPGRQGLLLHLESRWVPYAVLAIAIILHLAGIRKQLPYTWELDEDYFVEPAVRIASTGDLNPGWFGHPGSTIIYPLAALARLWHVVAHRGMLLRPDPNLAVAFQQDSSAFYMIGRLLSGTYWVLALLVTYRLGREVFGKRVAIIGLCLAAASPLSLVYAQTVRTDGASMFFGVLGMWTILANLRSPTPRRQVAAGIVIGFAIATKYYLAVLLLTLWWSNFLAWRRRKSRQVSALIGLSALGALASVASFVAATPFFLADWQTTLADVLNEMRPSHPGLVTFSPIGNLLWYMTDAIPRTLTWPNGILVGLGVLLLLRRNNRAHATILAFVLLFLVAISQSALHWQRWILQIVPMLSLIAAYAAVQAYQYLQRSLPAGLYQTIVCLGFGITVLVVPAYHLTTQAIREARPTTALIARSWIVDNIASGSHIARELYTAPLSHTGFVVWNQYFLSTAGSLETYCERGYRYLMVSSHVYDRWLTHPRLYPSEAHFYETLFREGSLVKEFRPSWLVGGGTIRLYELGCAQG